MTTTAKSPQNGRLIFRLSELQDTLALSRNAIERLIADEGFPAPIKLGPRSKGWAVDEVHDWLEQRKSQRDQCARPERPCT